MFKIYSLVLILICSISCDYQSIFSSVQDSKYKLIEKGTSPFSYRSYQLENGLKVYLSKNENSPRIEAQIGVKVGAKNDPIYNTGLSKYVEQMMFNGTSKIGTDNWENEKPILDQIKDQFDLRKYENDPIKREAILNTIDSLSILASEFSIANEYRNLVKEIGGQSIRSYTGLDETVYSSNIPNISLEKWAKIESERFSELTWRNFNFELQNIYELYNISQKSDDKLIYSNLTEKLFPDHPYGKQTEIGKGKHLENPSIGDIMDHFEKYYSSNNMVITISGDIDYDKTIEIIEKEFSKLQPQTLENSNLVSKNNKRIERKTIYQEGNDQIVLGYKLNGLNKENNINLKVIDRMFLNGFNGMLENDLIAQNRVGDAFSFPWSNGDYSMLILGGYPKHNQNLNDVENLLLLEVNKLKNGDFNSNFPQHCLNDIKKEYLVNCNLNSFRVNELLTVGLYNKKTSEYLNRFIQKKTINKNEIINFSKQNFGNNFAVIKKQNGSSKMLNLPVLKNSPIKLRKGYYSNFYEQIKNVKSLDITPQDIDLKNVIEHDKNSNLFYVKNSDNDLFSFNMVFDFGSFDEPKTGLALEYLKWIGGQEKSQLNSELFKLGGSWKVLINATTFTIRIDGLNENFKATVNEVINHFKSPKFHRKHFNELLRNKKKKRKDYNYKPTYILWEALLGEVQYKNDNPYISSLSNRDLDNLTEKEVIDGIKTLLLKRHQLFYCGALEKEDVSKQILPLFDFGSEIMNNNLVKIIENTPKKEVYFVNHETVQTELLFVGRRGIINENNSAFNLLFKDYFSTLSYRVIKESQALAYSTYFTINEAVTKRQSDYVYAYLGCQPDKLPIALTSLDRILKVSPNDELLFNEIKTKVLNDFKNKRKNGESVFWEWKKLMRKGFSEEHYQKTLRKLENFKFQDFVNTFDKDIKNIEFSLLIIGNQNEINIEDLKPYGPIINFRKDEILP